MLPSIQVESLSDAAQSKVPFTFGQVFAPGDLTLTDGLKVGTLALQVDVKALHADGTVRHAIVSGVLPALAGGDTISLQLAKGKGTYPVQDFTGVNALFTATIEGVVYTAAINPATTYSAVWLAGPVVDEYQYVVPLAAAGVPHPHLVARFAVRDYGADRQRVDVTIENNWAYEPGPQNFIYDATVTLAGVVVYEKTGLTHYHHARWRKIFWLGISPAVNVRPNAAYLISTRAVPNYDQSLRIADGYLSTLQSTFTGARTEPMGVGLATPYMPTTGGREDLGLMPSWYAAWLLSGDVRARDVSLGTADLAGSFSSHYRDRDTDRPVSVVDHPAMTLLGRATDTYNPYNGAYEAFPDCVGNCDTPNTPDTGHQAAFAYLPYVLTGDYYYLEELQFWAMWNALIDNPNYRKFEKGLFKSDQVRGQAWSMRTLAEAAFITPDDDKLKAQFISFLDANLDWYNVAYTTGAANALGVLTNGYAFSYQNETAIAPWQDDHFTSAIGHVAELGFDKAAPLLKWKAKFQIGRMVDPGFCWIDAAAYNLKLRDTAGSPVYTTLGQVYQNSVDPKLAALKCNTVEQLAYRNSIRGGDEAKPFVLNDMPGYASTIMGYPSNFQPALAMAVDSGYPGGAAAWDTFANRAVRPDYSWGPQFAILPRTVPTVIRAPSPVTPAAPVASVGAPTVAGTWAKIAAEGSAFTVPADTFVRYGAGGAWIYSKGSGVASNAFFGKDPAVNVVKTVEAFTPAAAKPGKLVTPSNVKLAKLTGLTLTIFDAAKLAPVKVFTGIAASTKGVLTVTDAALTSGTTYAILVTDAGGKAIDILFPITVL